MNTQIRLTSNGNFSPNIEFDLGNKYESVGDTLEFILPNAYQIPTAHCYLTFKMKKLPTLIFPVVDNIFTITRAITEHAGTYEIIFLITENEIVNGDIDEAVRLFVSNTMHGRVKDNYLQDPITNTIPDPNIETYYNKLDALGDQLQYNLDNNVYQGDYYFPKVDSLGNLSWSIKEGEASETPTTTNIRGPQGIQGGYYHPSEDGGVIKWNASQKDLPKIEDVDLNPYIKGFTDSYLNKNLANVVNEKVNNTIQLKWKEDTKELFIYITDDMLIKQ